MYKYALFFIVFLTAFSCGFIQEPRSFQIPPVVQEEISKIKSEIGEKINTLVNQGLSQDEIIGHLEIFIQDFEKQFRELIDQHSPPPFSFLPAKIKEPFIRQNIQDIKSQMKAEAEKLIEGRLDRQEL